MLYADIPKIAARVVLVVRRDLLRCLKPGDCRFILSYKQLYLRGITLSLPASYRRLSHGLLVLAVSTSCFLPMGFPHGEAMVSVFEVWRLNSVASRRSQKNTLIIA